MALETEGKTDSFFNSTAAQKQKDRILLLLRLVAFFATASATIVMALNKQTNSVVVATIGNNPIKATLTAKFQHTPAFVLVLYSLLILSLSHFYNDCVIVYVFLEKKKKRWLCMYYVLVCFSISKLRTDTSNNVSAELELTGIEAIYIMRMLMFL